MQYGQLHRRHRRRPSSLFLEERRQLQGPAQTVEPPASAIGPQSRARYRVVRVNGEWVVQIRQDHQN